MVTLPAVYLLCARACVCVYVWWSHHNTARINSQSLMFSEGTQVCSYATSTVGYLHITVCGVISELLNYSLEYGAQSFVIFSLQYQSFFKDI